MHLYSKKPLFSLKALCAVIIFIICVIFFAYSVGNVEESLDKNDKTTLESAINKAVATCYSIEGCYPENVEYLEDNYGIVIDHKRFTVIYDILGSNTKPNVIVHDNYSKNEEVNADEEKNTFH